MGRGDVLTVRPGGPGDAGSIHALLLEFNGEALPPEELRRRLALPSLPESVWLAEVGGEVVGVLVLRVVPTLSEPGDGAEITELFVRPGFRRRGAGRALVRTALDHCRRRGCAELHLLTSLANEDGQAFYRALGFQVGSFEMRQRILPTLALAGVDARMPD